MTTKDDLIQLDLRKVTRDADEFAARIYIRPTGHPEIVIDCGRIGISLRDGRSPHGEANARAAYGVTDVEHDSAYVFRIPVVSVQLSYVENGHAVYTGILLGRDPGDLRLSLDPTYDPATLVGAEVCDGKECGLGKPHAIVPSGWWSGPKKDPKLYSRLVGATVEISTNIGRRDP